LTATTNDLVIHELQTRLNTLEQTIKNDEARNYLLDLPRKFLGDAMTYSFSGHRAEAEIAVFVARFTIEKAERAIEKYGGSLQIIGG
jgi:hypothetical protein